MQQDPSDRVVGATESELRSARRAATKSELGSSGLLPQERWQQLIQAIERLTTSERSILLYRCMDQLPYQRLALVLAPQKINFACASIG